MRQLRIWRAKRAVEHQRRRATEQLRNRRGPHKLHFGCGNVRLEGWINVDLRDNAGIVDVCWDVTQPFPVQDGSCSHIYHEHLLEHLNPDDGERFLRDCWRSLAPGGVMRIATPCLRALVENYFSANWRDQEWLGWPEYSSISTPAEMLNISFRWWGHRWLYDREELHRRLRAAGFQKVSDVAWGESEWPDLSNLERRRDSRLICEVQK